ncbi:DUF4172 domain-containing protein [Brevundimonas sp.]|uniref:DUF4172 domain-containing protein n=1 Tax=Brevundimonas sp. TaxID=1871086 RepID=UPI00289BF793|nr:DUF4172 domain-containing protein [Brevundimonas sp.]
MQVVFAAKDAVIVTYVYEQDGWPGLRWSDKRLVEPLAAVRHRQGRLIGHMEALGFPLREEAVLPKPDRGRGEVQRDRGRGVGSRAGALLHRPALGHGCRRAGRI